MLSLIEYAIMDDAKTTHVMFVTESCIPIATMDELSSMLRTGGENCSFLDAYGRDSARCTRFDEHACFKIKDIPEEAIYKALPGWCLLSIKHARQILDLLQQLGGKALYPLFQKVWAPEEVFFPTALSLLGVLPGEEVVERSIMWAKWDERARGQERAHPIVYDGEFCRGLVHDARKEGCMFMRKWRRPLDVREWERVIYEDDSNSSQRLTLGQKRPREEGGDSGDASNDAPKQDRKQVKI